MDSSRSKPQISDECTHGRAGGWAGGEVCLDTYLALDDDADVVRVDVQVDERAIQVLGHRHLEHDVPASAARCRPRFFETELELPLVALPDCALGFSLAGSLDRVSLQRKQASQAPESQKQQDADMRIWELVPTARFRPTKAGAKEGAFSEQLVIDWAKPTRESTRAAKQLAAALR